MANSQPLQAVAFAARAGGGAYLAYCVPDKTVQCTHIALWRAGAGRAATVPGSKNATHVAIAAAPRGHMWVLWDNPATNQIRVVRTNAAVTRFGPVRTLAAPPKTAEIDGVQAEGSRGPLDVITLVLPSTAGASPAYFDTQLLPALRLRASTTKISHTRATTITFTVTDVGNPVSGATVSFLGHKATTNAKGVAKITVPRGAPTGRHTATASKNGYTSSTVTIKVT